jgi:NADH-quinone oxidoreductase subunit C
MIREYIYVKENLKKTIKGIIVKEKQIIIYIKNIFIIEVLKFMKKACFSAYKQLMDVFVVDYPNKKERFEINYVLLSIKFNKRIILKSLVEDREWLKSITKLFSSGYWLERECWDMFGLRFRGNKDLRRILTDYGFLGHPLRKDFPLTGFVEVRYDDNLKTIITEQLELSQDLRLFDFISAWVEISL